jgi:NAD+ synthase
METIKIDSFLSHINTWLLNYISEAKMKAFVVGVSGGIDSALTSTLCSRTGVKTIVVSLPLRQDEQQLRRAKNHINWLISNFENVEHIEINLTDLFGVFENLFSNNYNSELAFANSRSRLRMTALYQVAGSISGLVVGTGNKVEDFGVGFYTKYGDGGVDISPIADLLKSEVRFLASRLGVNQEIIDAKPTDGLWGDDRSDEDQIGASYDELEWAMYFIDNLESENSKNLSTRQEEVLRIYKKLNEVNQHKMRPIPVCKLHNNL